ncbi:hypothetical protein NCCP2716_17700 [Sporosarcina sp. NCCP-2716]|uniref:DUF302 domain-containing protein n=1 Tax=Sporosarcina sp. NCCP-2716 TaxID=2943679 RepID=UPI00203E3BD3|nr:DUF302 domain-containing protein [Sporosarcina sp. NCCP-2716]GKV69272.1 hypothetical protein NCCP2716_17700 [Sporosarcina sp. NCCP-2716]
MDTYVKTTDKTREEAVGALEAALKEAKFGVLWNFDMSATLESKGIQPPAPYTILEVCKPSIAEQVLSEELTAGSFLPCKIAVFEKDGRATISMPLPTKLLAGFGNQRMDQIAAEAEQQLKACIDQVAGS